MTSAVKVGREKDRLPLSCPVSPSSPLDRWGQTLTTRRGSMEMFDLRSEGPQAYTEVRHPPRTSVQPPRPERAL